MIMVFFPNICLILIIILLKCSSTKLDESFKINWNKVKPKECNGKNIFEIEPILSLNIMLHITAIYEVVEEKMEFGMQVQMTEIRENFELNLTEFDCDYKSISLRIPDHVVECLWQPDTIFYNAKESYLYQDTLPNRFLKLVCPWYYIIRSTRYKIIAACNMDFHLFPMDSQRCSLDIKLLAYRTNEVKLSWLGTVGNVHSVMFTNQIKPLNFQIELINATETLDERADETIETTLHANFLFKRSLIASVVNVYIPSFLIVCLSMISFWLDVEAVPGRVTLGVTAILTLFTEIVHVRSSLPTLDYMTAMDIWLLGCVIMVFLSMIEFTMAQSWSRRTTSIEVTKQENQGNHKNKVASLIWAYKMRVSFRNRYGRPHHRKGTATTQSNSKKMVVRRNESKKDNVLDRVSRIVFPLAMTCFTSLYWVYFYHEAYP